MPSEPVLACVDTNQFPTGRHLNVLLVLHLNLFMFFTSQASSFSASLSGCCVATTGTKFYDLHQLAAVTKLLSFECLLPDPFRRRRMASSCP
jgi:hypothetical protein